MLVLLVVLVMALVVVAAPLLLPPLLLLLPWRWRSGASLRRGAVGCVAGVKPAPGEPVSPIGLYRLLASQSDKYSQTLKSGGAAARGSPELTNELNLECRCTTHSSYERVH